MYSMMTRLPTGMDKYYLCLEKGLEKVRIFVRVEVWELCYIINDPEAISLFLDGPFKSETF